MAKQEFMSAAKRLSDVIENLDKSKPLLREAHAILRPIVDNALAGTLPLPGRLPHRAFFFGMYEDSLPANYLSDIALMNALGDFDEAWQNSTRD